MLEGLEISEVMALNVIGGTVTLRFDPEYFQKQYIEDEILLMTRLEDFCSFSDLGLTVDASAFYPSIEGYYDTGELPFLRVADVDSIIDYQGCTTIPKELCNLHPTLAKVSPGDILFTKGGSVARIGLVTKVAAVSRDLIFLNSSALSREDQAFLYIYFQSDFFNRALLRSSSQTAQPHLTITLVRDLRILRATAALKSTILSVVDAAFDAQNRAANLQSDAELALLQAIGLENWKAPELLSYVRNSSEAFDAGRLDAEHFQEKFYAAKRVLKSAGAKRFIPITELLTSLTNGHTPLRHDLTVGQVPFLCAEHVTDFNLAYESDKRILLEHHENELARTALSDGDVLLTIKGRIGNAAIAENVPGVVNINQDVALLRFNDMLPIWFVVAYLNCRFGKLQSEKMATGAINPFLGLFSIRQFEIPEFSLEVMNRIAVETRANVHAARTAKQCATQLLEAAKRAVEIAIEQSEVEALAYLDKMTTNQGG